MAAILAEASTTSIVGAEGTTTTTTTVISITATAVTKSTARN